MAVMRSVVVENVALLWRSILLYSSAAALAKVGESPRGIELKFKFIDFEGYFKIA